jgi:hypothetical protein
MNDLMVVEKLAHWEKLKALVLDRVSSPITKRVYNMALNEFLAWFQQAPRPGFTKATVSAWRVSLGDRKLGSSSILIRMSAIRKLAAEAADNALLAPELAAGISRVKSAKCVGIRVGNWLSVRQAQALLNAPDTATLRGLRDRAILAVLLGCGLRRSEVAALTFAHVSNATVGGASSISLAARASSHRSHADIGENRNRRLDGRGCRIGRTSVPARESRRSRERRRPVGEGRLATHQAVRRDCGRSRHRVP